MFPVYGAYTRGRLNQEDLLIAKCQEVFRHPNKFNEGCPLHFHTSWTDIYYCLNDYWQGNPVMQCCYKAPEPHLIERLTTERITRLYMCDPTPSPARTHRTCRDSLYDGH